MNMIQMQLKFILKKMLLLPKKSLLRMENGPRNVKLETNKYARANIDRERKKGPLSPRGFLDKWKGISAGELKLFLAIIIHMSLVVKPRLRDYWSTHIGIKSSFCKSTGMKRKRFEAILSMLHLNDNATYIAYGQPGYDPLHKLRTFLDPLVHKFKNVYQPDVKLTIDKAICPFRGRIHFRVYIKGKPHKYGIKMYQLCEASTGYTCNIDVYTGKHPDKAAEYNSIMSLVGRLAESNFEKGHIIYFDRWFSSPQLFEHLWSKKTIAVGMLHTTLVPIDLESSGEFIFIRYHDFCNMGGERLTLQVEQTIRTLSKEGNSYSVIVKKLKAEGLDVGKATICRVVNGIGKKREAESNGQKFQVDRPRPVRTPATVSKVHKLTPFHMKNRATNARKLYEEHLAGSRSEYTATLDEAWMYVTYCNGIRKIYYIKRGNQVPDNWVHQCSETFPKGFMVVGVMTGRGVLLLIKVPSKVKVNSEFYIECVLKPVIEQLKDLYPGEMDKVFLHHDKASSHTSNKTQQFLQEMKDTLGLNFIRNSDIPVKSPDASPLDFYGFGMLKQRLFNRRPKTEAGLWKAAQEEWSNVSLSKVKEVFAAWKVRCREIAKKKGKHIEHMKKIHFVVIPGNEDLYARTLDLQELNWDYARIISAIRDDWNGPGVHIKSKTDLQSDAIVTPGLAVIFSARRVSQRMPNISTWKAEQSGWNLGATSHYATREEALQTPELSDAFSRGSATAPGRDPIEEGRDHHCFENAASIHKSSYKCQTKFSLDGISETGNYAAGSKYNFLKMGDTFSCLIKFDPQHCDILAFGDRLAENLLNQDPGEFSSTGRCRPMSSWYCLQALEVDARVCSVRKSDHTLPPSDPALAPPSRTGTHPLAAEDHTPPPRTRTCPPAAEEDHAHSLLKITPLLQEQEQAHTLLKKITPTRTEEDHAHSLLKITPTRC
ncbi:PGBD5 [Cordylochernes scorpioides]|uniref:PGBD5 n=1 Tax=Cordylochernes scorpioides TaxID=51811 RepID=A0ABY6L022_9ARAC|nr:PGBD5 [Cordylochernes scorpioides]